MYANPEDEDRVSYQESGFPDSKPIEPEGKRTGKQGLFKWLFFLFVIVYVLLSYYHTPILIRLGRYLIVAHQPESSDLIVCLSGGNVERGLAVADAYQEGLAGRIFIAREEPPDGYALLKKRGVNYPESIDLFMMILEGLGVPRSALLTSDRPVKSTFDEAEIISEIVKERGYRSLIIITSPPHSRRAWLTFRKSIEESDVRILMLPSRYSEFRPEDWWKRRRYVKTVIIEYQKLIYYALENLW